MDEEKFDLEKYLGLLSEAGITEAEVQEDASSDGTAPARSADTPPTARKPIPVYAAEETAPTQKITATSERAVPMRQVSEDTAASAVTVPTTEDTTVSAVTVPTTEDAPMPPDMRAEASARPQTVPSAAEDTLPPPAVSDSDSPNTPKSQQHAEEDGDNSDAPNRQKPAAEENTPLPLRSAKVQDVAKEPFELPYTAAAERESVTPTEPKAAKSDPAPRRSMAFDPPTPAGAQNTRPLPENETRTDSAHPRGTTIVAGARPDYRPSEILPPDGKISVRSAADAPAARSVRAAQLLHSLSRILERDARRYI